MSLASILGLDKIGEQSVEEAHQTINDALDKAEPLLVRLFNLAGGILHGIVDRFDVDIRINIKLNPVTKAERVNEP